MGLYYCISEDLFQSWSVWAYSCNEPIPSNLQFCRLQKNIPFQVTILQTAIYLYYKEQVPSSHHLKKALLICYRLPQAHIVRHRPGNNMKNSAKIRETEFPIIVIFRFLQFICPIWYIGLDLQRVQHLHRICQTWISSIFWPVGQNQPFSPNYYFYKIEAFFSKCTFFIVFANPLYQNVRIDHMIIFTSW